MYCYIMYGKKIYTDLYFRQLVPIEPVTMEEADVVILEGKVSDAVKQGEKEKNFSYGKEYGFLCNYTLWYEYFDGRRIVYERKEGANEEYVRTYLLGFGLSFLLLQRGELVVHCSAVSKDGKAYLVAGESGSGKSTITKVLLENGFTLMGDDTALVKVNENQVPMVYPAFPYQKLCRDVVDEKGLKVEELILVDEEKDKYLVPYEGAFSTEPVPFGGLFCLAVGNVEACIFETVNGVEKMQLCAMNLFARKLLGKKVLSPEIAFECFRIIGNVPVHTIIRPRVGDSAKEIWQYIQRNL